MSTALATLAGKLAERVGMDSVNPQELITTLRQTAFKGDASDAQFIALLIVATRNPLKAQRLAEEINNKRGAVCTKHLLLS